MTDKHCGTCAYEVEAHSDCKECIIALGGYPNWIPKDEYIEALTFNQYQISSGRTDNHADQKEAMTNFAFGICGEAGEVVDLVKKFIFHGHPIDKDKFKLELGDQLWYISRMAAWAGLTLEEVAKANIEKLMARYPDGFSQEKSINREGET